MTAETAPGAPAAALAAYEQLRQTLAEELGTDPSEETQALHLTILRGTPTPPDPNRPMLGASGAPDPNRLVPGSNGRARPQPAGTGGPIREGSPSAGKRGRVVHSPTAGTGRRVPHSPTGGGGVASDVPFVGREGEVGNLTAAWEGAVAEAVRAVAMTCRRNGSPWRPGTVPGPWPSWCRSCGGCWT